MQSGGHTFKGRPQNHKFLTFFGHFMDGLRVFDNFNLCICSLLEICQFLRERVLLKAVQQPLLKNLSPNNLNFWSQGFYFQAYHHPEWSVRSVRCAWLQIWCIEIYEPEILVQNIANWFDLFMWVKLESSDLSAGHWFGFERVNAFFYDFPQAKLIHCVHIQLKTKCIQ